MIPHDWVTIDVTSEDDKWSQCARCNRVRLEPNWVKRKTTEWCRGAEVPAGDCPRGDMTEERAKRRATTQEVRMVLKLEVVVESMDDGLVILRMVPPQFDSNDAAPVVHRFAFEPREPHAWAGRVGDRFALNVDDTPDSMPMTQRAAVAIRSLARLVAGNSCEGATT